MKEEKTAWKKQLGNLGERLAEDYLSRVEGLLIVEKNFRCKIGEIDIIARDGDFLVFVEVRSSSTDSPNRAAESIGFQKQKKLKQVASYYLLKKGLTFTTCRFDVVIMVLDKEKPAAREIRYIKNAFS